MDFALARRRVFSLAALVLFVSDSSSVFGFCSEPSAPNAPWSPPPTAPYCFNEWDRTHTCDQWEIDSWIDEINKYINEMADYANEAQEFARDAVDYANCQIEEAKSPLE